MFNQQNPIHSGFGATTTAREVLNGVDLYDKVAIVTGGYSGIGLETTRALAEAGATVIVPVRSPEKAHQALQNIPRVEQYVMDLLDAASIDAFANEFLSSGRSLHILINNAGIMATPLERDARGYESQFSANHLGHFQLTLRLWPALCRAGNARVVSVASAGHQIANIDFDDPNFERRSYDRWQAYGQAKTANTLFAVEVERRGTSEGIHAFVLHPGAILTELSRNMTEEELGVHGFSHSDKPGSIPVGKSVAEGGDFKTLEQGAATSVWCATSSQLTERGGVYCEDVEIAQVRQPDAIDNRGVESYAIDPQAAQRLWHLSEQLTGVRC